MSNKGKFTLTKIKETITNGRVNNKRTAMNPMGTNKITYVNSKSGNTQTQSYLEMQDLIVPVLVKKDKQSGELHFAMQYEYVPSSKYGVQLELPDFPFFNEKKDNYSEEDVSECIKENLNYLDLKLIGFKYLDSGTTAINQSITDQIMKVVYVYVKDSKNADNNLEWFPVSSLQDYLHSRPIGLHAPEYSCMKTKYALRLFYEKFKNEIDKKKQTKFTYREDLFNRRSPWQQKKTIMENKYRFGTALVENIEAKKGISNYGSVFEIGTSRNSVECLITKRENKKVKIGLSRQQRSPFIAREGISEFFYEEVGGMVEEGESYEEALRREVPEETGIPIKNGKLHKMSNPIMLGKGTQESSVFYIYEMSGDEKHIGQSLDSEESIEDMEWFDLDEIDLNKLHAPIPTKYAITLAREHFERNRDDIEHPDFDR